MTGTAKKARTLQNPTDWQDVPENRDSIPTDTVMLLELGIGENDLDYALGFFSSRTKAFLEIPTKQALEETCVVIGYHILYNRKAETLTAYSEY